MPNRAFIPGPIAQAQPRVYKSFRGRQLRGLILAAVSAGVAIMVFGVRDLMGYGATFLATIPGLAYGYYQPDGKPVEYWLRTALRYHTRPRVLSPLPRPSAWHRFKTRVRFWFNVITRARRLARKGADRK